MYLYSIQTINLSKGVRLAYTDCGAGPETILFIHGLGSYLPAWNQNIPTLSQHFRCIAIDLPNYGQSGSGDFPFSISFFAEVIRELIETLSLRSVILAGHSMGAQIALKMVLCDASEIDKLILIAPAGFETFTEVEKHWIKSIYNPVMMQAAPMDQILKNFEVNFVKMPQEAAFMIEDRLELMKRPQDYARYCRMIQQCVTSMLDEPIFEQLTRIRTPSLIIYGEQDYLIPNQLLHQGQTTRQIAIAGHLRLFGSRMLMVPNAGHFVQFEKPAAVNEAILHFTGKSMS